MRERTHLDGAINQVRRFEQRLKDAVTLIELGEAEEDEASVAEAEKDLYFLPKSAAEVTGAAGGPVRLEEVAGETLVLTGDGCGLAAVTRDLFAAHGLEVKAYPGVALSYQMLQDWAEVGIGAALLPLSKISPENRGRARPMLLKTGAPAQVVFEAFWKRNAEYPPHLDAIHNHFRTAVPQLVRGKAA